MAVLGEEPLVGLSCRGVATKETSAIGLIIAIETLSKYDICICLTTELPMAKCIERAITQYLHEPSVL